MIQPPADDRRPPITPQLAMRVAVMGGIALLLFAIIFFRLWFLQVLSGDQYVAQANDNQVREQVIQAPRGDIVDRSGAQIVTNRQATVVQVDPGRLPPAGAPRRALYRRIGQVVGLSEQQVQARVVRQRRLLPYANAVIKTDVPDAVTAYVNERKPQFPGVSVDSVYVREYPHKNLAAQLLGYVGQINGQQLKSKRYAGIAQGTVIGQNGIEYEYDRYLRGRDGADLLRVNSLGTREGYMRRREPVPGRQLKLSLDMGLQKAGQDALLRAGGGKPGAFVALDPRNGEVLAMGSNPSFDPSLFSKPLSEATYKSLVSTANGAPLINRAIEGAYPTGSTFKPITALAALNSGQTSVGEVIADNGCIKVGEADRCNAGKAANGPVSLVSALRVSSDVYFYTMGLRLNAVAGQPLQRWARRLGLGHSTKLDLPTEAAGTVPDRAWRAARARQETQCERKRKVSSCGISDKRPWSLGDEVNLAIGQGDLQASPLQMAVAYSTIENDGTVVRPHLGLDVEDGQGRLIQKVDPPAARHVALDAGYRGAILQGLHQAASQPGGTSADVFSGWPQTQYPVFGKTGTAQRNGQQDQSWYVAFVPDARRPIVIATTIEQGGFGAAAAAPATRLMLSKWFHVKPKFVSGSSSTR
jgi:penicillin-binding protein 2